MECFVTIVGLDVALSQWTQVDPTKKMKDKRSVSEREDRLLQTSKGQRSG